MTRRILQVIQEFSTAGGAETVAFELSQALSRAEIPNGVLASKIEGVPASMTKAKIIGGFLSAIPTRGALRYIGRLIVVPLFSVIATWNVRKHADSIVISHGDCMAGDMMVIHAVNAASLEQKRQDGHWLWMLNPMHYFVSMRDRWTLGARRFKRYIAVSRRVEDELVQYYKIPLDRIRIIPNGIDLERFVPKPGVRSEIRADFGIPGEAQVLLFVGHEFRRKGLEYVIRALDHLPESCWILVVGSDDPAPYREIMPHLNERIVFAGARRNMTDFYAAADAFVFPTNYETFSLVCMEALACGTPVLATRVGGIEDYLMEGQNGYFITRDADTIAEKVRHLFADPTHYKSLSMGARETAENYSWDKIAQLYVKTAEEIAAVKYPS
jgi:UDP-glucose:(heptosyl)LPS alpha-1,3-glucosyltransferase